MDEVSDGVEVKGDDVCAESEGFKGDGSAASEHVEDFGAFALGGGGDGVARFFDCKNFRQDRAFVIAK